MQSKSLSPDVTLGRVIKVLIAEDEPLLQMSLEDILNDIGCEVVASVASVKAALACIGLHSFDVAILDVHLADGACDPVVARLNELNIPMVFATGALAAGQHAGPVVGKPYDPVEIEQAIAAAAGR